MKIMKQYHISASSKTILRKQQLKYISSFLDRTGIFALTEYCMTAEPMSKPAEPMSKPAELLIM